MDNSFNRTELQNDTQKIIDLNTKDQSLMTPWGEKNKSDLIATLHENFPGVPHLAEVKMADFYSHNEMSRIGRLIEIIQESVNILKKDHGIIVESVVDLRNGTVKQDQFLLSSNV